VQYSIKKNAQKREEAMRDSKDLPPMLFVPLPTWKDTKDRLRGQMETTRAAFHTKGKEWEAKEQVW
jgi:hypothetical protein